MYIDTFDINARQYMRYQENGAISPCRHKRYFDTGYSIPPYMRCWADSNITSHFSISKFRQFRKIKIILPQLYNTFRNTVQSLFAIEFNALVLFLVILEYILREKSFATYFRDSQLWRTGIGNLIISKYNVDKRLRVRWHYLFFISYEVRSGFKSPCSNSVL